MKVRRMLAAMLAVLSAAACTSETQPSDLSSDSTDAVLSARCEAAAPQGPELPHPISVQLHTHGLSNHGSSSRPNSMQFASSEARRLGLNAIWWTDHLPYYVQDDSVDIRPASGKLDPDSLTVSGQWADVSRLGFARSGQGTASASLQTDGVELSVRPAASGSSVRAGFTTQHVWIDGRARWPESLRFNRPLTSGAELQVQYRFCGVGPQRLHVLVRLAWHIASNGSERQQVLHYVLGTDITDSTRVVGRDTVVVQVPAAQAATVVLDLAGDGSLLPDGDDNTVGDIGWYVEATTNEQCTAVERVVLRSRTPAFEDNWHQAVEFANRYGGRDGLLELIGFEGWVISPEHRAAGVDFGGVAGTHMNAFLPHADASEAKDFLTLGGRALVRRVHELCGVAAVNHPFGYGFVIPDSAQRVATREAVTAFLVRSGAMNADLIEILPRRGDGLDGHLAMWDRLSANGVRLCGIGTMDVHGWRWDDPLAASFTENRNPYVTWVWAREFSRRGLVSALRRCRAYFGDPFRFSSGWLDLHLDGGGVMGELVTTYDDSVVARPLFVAPAGIVVQLIQGRRTPDGFVEYLRREPVDSGSAVTVTTETDSFVRLEARQADGLVVAMSNPIWIRRDTLSLAP